MNKALQRAKNLAHVKQHYGVSFYEKIFLIYIADMAIQMSNIDNFDIDQMSSKFAQREHFVCNFYCKKISILGSLLDAENAKCLLFY